MLNAPFSSFILSLCTFLAMASLFGKAKMAAAFSLSCVHLLSNNIRSES